jgi:hypothetical protein
MIAGSEDRIGPGPSYGACRWGPLVALEDRIHDRPGCLDRILTGEEGSVAVHGVAQQPRRELPVPAALRTGRAPVGPR